MSSCLYIVSSPIGNLKDITLRAIDILKAVDTIYCEDTRRTSSLCKAYGISTPLKSYHEHNAQQMRPLIIEQLKKGDSVALVSDAGTPLISDPGYKLVDQCLEQNIKVSPIPGASALLAALVVSGLPPDQFYFGGFLSSKSNERKKTLLENKNCSMTQIYYETPNRLIACLKDLVEIYEDRKVCVARELTKSFEEAKQGTSNELIQYYENEGVLKGEVVLLIDKTDEIKTDLDPDAEEVLKLLLQHTPVKKAVSLMVSLTGQPKNKIYKKALELKDEN